MVSCSHNWREPDHENPIHMPESTYDDFLTRKYHSHSNRTCFAV